jgi:hypothetical protein
VPAGGGNGMKCRKPFNPITKKITPARYRAIADAILITELLLDAAGHCIDVIHIDINIIDAVCF